MIISTVANEIVAVLSAFGVVTKLSNSMLGLSVLALGNSIGDLISNITLARIGYAKMGFSACFGGPMFSKLINIFKFHVDIIFFFCRFPTWHWYCVQFKNLPFKG